MFRVSRLLVELEPRDVAFAVSVLQAKEPHLPQTHRLHHLKSHTLLFLSVYSWYETEFLINKKTSGGNLCGSQTLWRGIIIGNLLRETTVVMLNTCGMPLIY